MRYSVLFPLLFFCSVSLFAQDTLVKRDGSKIAAKVLEVNPTELRYKRSDSPDGPVYVIKHWDLMRVIYAGGRTESYETVQSPVTPPLPPSPPPPPTVVDLSIQRLGKHYYYKERNISETNMLVVASKLKDHKVDLMIKKVQEKKFIQNACIIGGAGVFTAGFFVWASNQAPRSRRGSPVSSAAKTNARQNGEYLMLGGAALEVVAFTFKFDRVKHAHMVMDLYNQAIAR